MQDYNHKKIEKKWQDIWQKKKVFVAQDKSKKPKFYGLIEFPYPSGDGLHVGHVRGDMAMDVISRKRRMEGFNVLYPIGWDAFGLPTENYAIKTGIHPSIVTKQNTDNFRRQLKLLGLSFDWSREINTTDPKYYKWTQWIFLQLLKHGLAYKKKMPINWCPKDKIGLANEEVVDGCCERCGTRVEKRDKEQWMLAITKYADRLDKDLDTVDYLGKIKIQQRNWIGRSEGSEIEFRVLRSAQTNADLTQTNAEKTSKIKVFTTRPDTLFGCTYLVLAPEHSLVESLKSQISNWDETIRYIVQSKKKTEMERTEEGKDKTGIELKGVKAINPANGEEVPVWIADYVLAEYGTGAIMAVPAHDERDFEFAKKYSLPIIPVIMPIFGQPAEDEEFRHAVSAFVRRPSDGKYLFVKVKEFNRITKVYGGIEHGESPGETAIREVFEETGYKTKFVRDIGWPTQSHFYHPAKKVNRLLIGEMVELELIDEKQYERSANEASRHEAVWFSLDEAKKVIDEPKESNDFSLFEGSFCFIGEGIMTNSGKFDGMNSEEAKWKITKEVGGKKITRFKLRDWVFSRQHYWGEPIPVVFCENCKNTKQKVLIIHGFEGSPETNWKPWMKSELEKRGFEVRVPKMSTSEHPDLKQWLKELLPLMKDFGPNDIVIGHSLGSKAALHLLLKAKKKIGHLLLVASAIGEMEKRDWDKIWKDWQGSDIDALKKFWDEKIDLNKISDYAENVRIVISKDDPYVPLQTHEDIPKDWNFEVWDGFGHFDGKVIPELLEWILRAKNDGWVPVPEKDLPVELPKVEKYQPTDTGESPLAGIKDFVHTRCPQCGGPAKRETDTMPNWAGSSWYYLRYIDPKNNKELVGKEKLNYWFGISNNLDAKRSTLNAGPVNWYNGGMEHTTLHLLYSRFWHKFLFDIGVVPTSEPYKKRTSHGLILAEGGVKMSKSKGNVINPDDLVERFGADALRVYEMFMGPFDQAIAWNTDGIVGTRRFIEKVWRIADKLQNPKNNFQTNSKSQIPNSKLDAIVHRTIKKVDEDIEEMRFNTAISALMICANEMDSAENVPKELFEMFLKILSPFAPHIAEELWQNLGNKSLIVERSWPAYDPNKIKDEMVTIVVQVNGKVRGEFSATPDIAESEAIEKAKSLPEIKRWLADKPLKKAIFVKGRLVNFVV